MKNQMQFKRVVLALVVTLALTLALTLAAGTAFAQSSGNSGQIGGQVLDPSGAAVSGVEVASRSLATNQTRTVTTDDAGRYAIGPVPVGEYEVTVKPANMEASSQNVFVSLGGRANATFNLGIKPVSESVNDTWCICSVSAE